MSAADKKRLAVGILAHVDAGKTTLSEALLYRSGALRTLGRVDHGDAYLDTDAIERERGITIFSKQAVLTLDGTELTLLDTPGHVDFSSEMERTLSVLDYAVLVISGTDGVQGHTLTLWRLLERSRVPVFLFINKMDLPGADRAALLDELRRRLDGGCVDFGAPRETLCEEAAMCDESVLEQYLESGAISDGTLTGLIGKRRLFPCFFGSALRLGGVDELLSALGRYTRAPDYPPAFGARIFKVSRDQSGARLTHLKVTGGVLRVKALMTNRRSGMPDEQIWEDKADQIRIYSGAKYKTADEVLPGTVCAVTGLGKSRPGEGLGWEAAAQPPLIEPVFAYRVLLPDGCDAHAALLKLRMLEEEDPQLRIAWNERLREICIQLMGEVQMEILKRRILERFGLDVSFGKGGIVYRETIKQPVRGAGHFEPLRHYAEVHLLLEPAGRGEGITYASACSEDMLDRSWQRLILSQLAQQTIPGVLTGAPITDMRITLLAGRAHEKHTEGGDFRQAALRAVRQGLMQAENVLLEPWYSFRLEVPGTCVGRAMSDLQRMYARVSAPETAAGGAVLTGAAPAACMRDYAAEVSAYTKGRGRLFCTLSGYEPCHNQGEVAAAAGYDCEHDLDFPADSVFCAHGAGYTVKWSEAAAHMHVDPGRLPGVQVHETDVPAARGTSRETYSGTLEQDRELEAIFERTYGPIRRGPAGPARAARQPEGVSPWDGGAGAGPEYLLVDGYNMIFAWEDFKRLARDHLDAARQALMDLLCNYQGFRKCAVILVFDAYKVPRGTGAVSRYHNIHVVYTKEAETADAFIEKVTYEIGGRRRVRVATSDSAEQLIILGHGALRVSADLFRMELERTSGEITAFLEKNNRLKKSLNVRAALERAGGSAKAPKRAADSPGK